MKRNYLRAIAITLIVLPEPFTTPFGVALLAVSYLLPKKHKDSLRNIEDLVRRYSSISQSSRITVKKSFGNPHVTSLHDSIDKRIRTEFQNRYLTDSHRVSDGTVFHVLRTGVPQYQAPAVKPVNIVHHTLRTSLEPAAAGTGYSGLKPITRAKPEVIIHHSLKRH